MRSLKADQALALAMRPGALLLFALSLALLPAAVADQSVDAGPVHVTTVSVDSGDGCGAGGNGYGVRSVVVHVDDPRAADGFKEAGLQNQCTAYDAEWGSGQGAYLSIYAYSQEFGTPGPSVGYQWYGWSDGSGARTCGGSISVGGTSFMTGCPSPDGSAPPLLPTLP